MRDVSSVIESRLRYLERQLKTMQDFVLQPTGVFETVDRMVRNFRAANRQTLMAIGVPVPGARGQIMEQGPIRRILKRLIGRIRG